MAKIDQDINEALINDVLQIYANAEDKMLKAVAKRVAKGIKTEGWNEQKLNEVQALHKEIEGILGNTKKLSDAKVSKGIIDAYKSGVQEVDGEKTTHNTVLDELDIPTNLKMQVLATNNLLSNASFQVLRKADDAYQKVMAHATTGLLSGVDTRRQASQRMLNEFASKGITSFTDKAGRNWDLGSYAEMCARTVSQNAARQGHFDRQLEVGEDLVKVSKIGTTCPICQRWQGVVLSISGNHPKYHSMEEAKASGLFHPNCKHTFNMYIEDLDGPGKVEPDAYSNTTTSSKQYNEIQKQRTNERNIRYWKKRKALAISPEAEIDAAKNIKAWQYKNLIHCEKNGLRRNYAREGVMSGNATGPIGALTGGSLKEYEEVFKHVVGEEPKKLFMKLDLSLFSYKKWLRDEIKSLDDLDVDRSMMKDSSRKDITPTSLYKKYIGDEPGKDYAEVSPYEKGTKEYKSGYAKWLKEQIEAIGTKYGVKPEYKTIHVDIPFEDTKLSATEFYKKYHDGEKPTDAFKKQGGEEGTGMKYGKWVETQKKELIRKGYLKKVPFESSTMSKTTEAISTATEVIKKAKEFVDETELKKFKEKASKIIDPKKMSVEMKELSSKISSSSGREKELLEKEYEILKERDLDILREVVKKAKLGSSVGDVDFEMKWLKDHILDSKTIPDDVKAHVRKKYDIWAERKKIIEHEEKVKRQEEDKRRKEEERKKLVVDSFKAKLPLMDAEELEAFKKSPFFKKDPDYAIKIKAIDEFFEEKKKAKLKKEADEKRMQELERRKKELDALRSKGGYIPRDEGAKILDDMSEFYSGVSAKRHAKRTIEKIATNLGMSAKEAKIMLDNDLKAIFQECELGARIRGSVLEKVLSDDPKESGFKNLFEVGTGGGCTNKSSRSNGENVVFGYQGDAKDWENNKKDRPFYGMMMPKFEKGNFSENYYKKGPGRWYGDGITLIFDKTIASNVSFTVGDSLDYKGQVVGCEATNPEFRGSHDSFERNYIQAKNRLKDLGSNEENPNLLLTKIASSGDEYLELQYHGHQTKNDMVNFIKHVYIEENYFDVKRVTSLLDKKGIPYTLI